MLAIALVLASTFMMVVQPSVSYAAPVYSATTLAYNGLTAYSGAGVGHAKVGYVDYGTELEIHEAKDGYYKFKLDTSDGSGFHRQFMGTLPQYGWIYADYTDVTWDAYQAALNASDEENAYTSAIANLCVRKGPGHAYGAIGSLDQFDQITATGEKFGYVSFDYKGQTGWVAKKYLWLGAYDSEEDYLSITGQTPDDVASSSGYVFVTGTRSQMSTARRSAGFTPTPA